VATVKVNGVELFYKETGRGPETIVFSHGLLMDHTMFEAQRAAFEGQYRVIAYDHRGQGLSGRSKDPGDGWGEGMDNLATDAAALIQALDAGPCHFAGLSMGGFVGMRLAIRRPALLRSLTLMNTGAEREPWPNRARYGFLAQLARVIGMAPFTGVAVKALFGESTRRDPQRRAMLEEWTGKIRKRPRHVADALSGVMERDELTAHELRSINCPTLVIAGQEDTARPPADSERLAAFIPGAKLVRIPGCGHSSSLEAPEAVTEAMRGLIGTRNEVRRTSGLRINAAISTQQLPKLMI
jgi:pimeloyl-ACP methyl ester carboxylesterase